MFNIIDEVKKIEKDIINWRRRLHQIPEGRQGDVSLVLPSGNFNVIFK